MHAPWLAHAHAHTCMLSGTVRKLKITFVSLSLSVSRFSTHEQNLAAGDEKEAEEPEKEAEERCKIQLPSRFLLQDSRLSCRHSDDYHPTFAAVLLRHGIICKRRRLNH